MSMVVGNSILITTSGSDYVGHPEMQVYGWLVG